MTSEKPVVAAVGVKVPPFWPHKPTLWFVNLEAQFALANITADSTRYAHLISCLDAKHATEVEDIITNPPSAGKYEKLKAEIIRRLSLCIYTLHLCKLCEKSAIFGMGYRSGTFRFLFQKTFS